MIPRITTVQDQFARTSQQLESNIDTQIIIKKKPEQQPKKSEIHD